MSELDRPPPPVVLNVNHCSIKLSWEEALEAAVTKQGHGKGGRIGVRVQEEDSQDSHAHSWNVAYAGYAKYQSLERLDPQTIYRYRVRFQNDIGASEWSAATTVATTKQPFTGEDIHKAIIRNNRDDLERVLESHEVFVDVNDKYGFSPLMQAAQRGQVEIMELLIENGADVNLANESGKTSLMLACFSGNLESVQKLREHGAEYNLADKGGSFAIHWAVDGGNLELLNWVINDGVDVNACDKYSHWTPLHRTASVGGNKDVAAALLQTGARINDRDVNGKTALMIAVINGHQGLVDCLLKNKVDLSMENEFGQTALDMAHAMEKRHIVKTMEAYMQSLGIKK